MNILVINGSPKGKNSITLQSCLYLEKCFPKHRFQVLHAGATVGALEKDFAPAARLIGEADVLLFSYPVYTFIAPSQLHRFIAKMKAEPGCLHGQYVTQLTTSKHFYDITAHRYIEQNAADMGLRVIHGLSADMDDLTTEKGRRQCEDFFRYLCWCVERGSFEPLPEKAPDFRPVPADVPEAVPGDRPGDIVVVTDCGPEDTSLRRMLDRFARVSPRSVREVNLRDFPFRGGCLGCFHCAFSGSCVYPDGFDSFLRDTIQRSEAIVYAFTVRDHSMGPLFKCYDDRQFCNGHRTVTMGTPQGYLVSGPLSREDNLRMIIDGRASVGGNFLCGTATDETDPNAAVDRLAMTLDWAIAHHYAPPANFLGVGGMKIFRDLIWLMRGLMRADHRFFREHGQYDFPQKQKGRALAMYLVGGMMRSKAIQKKAGGKMTEGMLAPYTRALENAKPLE